MDALVDDARSSASVASEFPRMISDLEIAIRLAVAAALGSLIGFERERLLWAAGLRTHMLVSIGACLLMIVSAYGFQHALLMPHVILDPSRVAAQVVSGIGFLGAGAILMRGQIVRGMTTAASIWAVAAVGLAAGGGMIFAATVSTAIIIAVLAGVKPLEEAYRLRVQSCVIHITADKNAVAADAVKKLLGVRANQIRRVVIEDLNGGETQRISVHLAPITRIDAQNRVSRIREKHGIQTVEISRKHTLDVVQPE
jgi:putative Mg2+ transporter-C (MgtC) family protein